MQSTSAYTETVFTYANTVNTHEGGTHEEGFRAALTSRQRFACKQNQLKERDENLSGDDVREGLTAVISVKLSEPQFEGQTKTKLGNTEAKAFVQREKTDELGGWFDRHPNEGRENVRKAIQAAAARMAARKAREATRKRVFESAACPAAARLPAKDPRAEVFIVEGDSAGGSAAHVATPHAGHPPDPRQDPQRRAGPPRQGPRQPGGAGADPGFGTGIGEDFDIEKARYHKIVLMADADVDGMHIRSCC